MLVPGFRVKAVDTTGCGDAFLAGLLCGIARRRARLSSINLKSWYDICLSANAMGALTAMKEGGIPALPDSQEVSRFLKEYAS